MIILETDDQTTALYEVQITIDISKLYAEIVEVYKASENGFGFVIVTNVKTIEPNLDSQQDNLDSQQDNDTDFRRLEL
jgi:hypothetical protein